MLVNIAFRIAIFGTNETCIFMLDAESNFRYFSTMVEKLTQGVPSMPECIVIGML